MDINFEKINFPHCTITIHKDFRNSDFEQALTDGEKALAETYDLTSISASEFANVYKFSVNFPNAQHTFYFKQYLCRSLWDFAKHIFRPSRAKRAFRASVMLTKNGFDVPTVVAMAEHKDAFLNTKNSLVTLEVKNARQLWGYVNKNPSKLTKEQLKNKRQLIRRFGQTIGALHAKGIFHGDLRIGNVLAKLDHNQTWRFFFLDNERTRKFAIFPPWLRVKNLVQINMHRNGITQTDRIRFFKAYLHQNPGTKNQAQKLAARVTKKTNHRIRKIQSS